MVDRKAVITPDIKNFMKDYKQQVIDFFNRRTNYDNEGSNHLLEAKQLLEYVAIAPNQTILDLATGTGLIAIDAAQKVTSMGSVIGVDISSGMLAQAKEKIVSQGLDNLELIKADIESIEFQPEQFDRIFCCSAIMYVENIPQMFAKCYSWLTPGGYFAFSTSYKTAYNGELKVRICRELFGIDYPQIKITKNF